MANPFDDDNDDKYSSARRSNAAGPIKSYGTAPSSMPYGNIDDDVNEYERQIEKCMQDSLDSTQRSRKQLEQSEQVGVATAQDLLVQREKLERANKNLDEIDQTTAQTQRSLNSLKSVFGGFFKNKFSRAPKATPKIELPTSAPDNPLQKTVSTLRDNESAGAMATTGPTLSDSSRQAMRGTRWEVMDNEIDENLDAMSANLARLRSLGTALGSEVDDQNKLLDDIQRKADKSDGVIRHQDNQMKKILGYKTQPPGESAGLAPSSSSNKSNKKY